MIDKILYNEFEMWDTLSDEALLLFELSLFFWYFCPYCNESKVPSGGGCRCC